MFTLFDTDNYYDNNYNFDNFLYDMDFDTLLHEFTKIDKECDNEFLIIASLGLWNGRVTGYKIIRHLQDIFNSINADAIKVYIDKQNLHIKYTHHDGTNYITIRKLKDKNYNSLLNDLYYNKSISNSKLNYYTENLYKELKEYYRF